MFVLFISQRLHRIDPGGSAGRQEAGQQRDSQDDQDHLGQDERVGRTDPEELISHKAREAKRGKEPHGDSNDDQTCSFYDDQAQHVTTVRAHGQADADFARAPCDGIGQHAIDAKSRQEQSDPGEHTR